MSPEPYASLPAIDAQGDPGGCTLTISALDSQSLALRAGGFGRIAVVAVGTSQGERAELARRLRAAADVLDPREVPA